MFRSFRRNRLSSHSKAFIREFYQQPAVDLDTVFNSARICSIDLETSGLVVESDRILAIAMVFIEHGKIDLTQSRYWTLNYDNSIAINESILVHGLHPEEVNQGLTPNEVLPELLSLCRNTVFLAHNVTMDWTFLNRLLWRFYKSKFIIPTIDTLAIEQKRLERKQAVVSGRNLSLSACRKRYGLYEFAEHDARNDAMATAELLLAQVARMGGGQRVTLKDLGARWRG